MERVAVLVRHGEAEPPGAGPDADRPLTARGRRQAAATAAWLARRGLAAPDLALASPALRAGQTWQELAAAGVDPGTAREEAGLHASSAAALVALLAALPDEVASVLVVGHEPVLSQAAVALAAEGSDGAALARLRAGLGTGEAVVLAVEGGWDDVRAGAARLVALGPA